MSGWISLHRKIRNNPVFNDLQLLRLWLICLTEASHKEHTVLVGKQTVTLQPGQFVTGRFDLYKMYNAGLKPKDSVTEFTVWRWLQTLEKLDFLHINSSNKYSVVTIVKWRDYQGYEQQNEQQNAQQMHNKCTTNAQQMSTNNNGNKGNNGNKEIIKDIVLFLNQQTGKHFKHTTNSTVKLINGRLSEGYTIDDFKKVITIKTKEWLRDKKMNQYLAPDTLFRPGNFEKYLNQDVKQDAVNGGRSKDPYAGVDFGF